MKPKQTLDRLFAHYQPRPGASFHQKMAAAPWHTKEASMQQRSPRAARLGWQFALVVVFALSLLAMVIPPVRASLSAWLGLSVAPANQQPADTITLVAPASPTPTVAATQTAVAPAVSATPAGPQPTAATQPPARSVPAEVEQLSAQTGWPVLYPAALPEGYQLSSAFLDANHQAAILTFTAARPLPGDPALTATRTITLIQAKQNDFIPMQVAPDTSVEDVLVNGQPAVFAAGAWDSEFVADQQDPNGGKMVSTWRGELPVLNLFWQVGDVYLVLISDDPALSSQDMIELGGNIR